MSQYRRRSLAFPERSPIPSQPIITSTRCLNIASTIATSSRLKPLHHLSTSSLSSSVTGLATTPLVSGTAAVAAPATANSAAAVASAAAPATFATTTFVSAAQTSPPVSTTSSSSPSSHHYRTKYYQLQARASQPILTERHHDLNDCFHHSSVGNLLNELQHFSLNSTLENFDDPTAATIAVAGVAKASTDPTTLTTSDVYRSTPSSSGTGTASTTPTTPHRNYIKKSPLLPKHCYMGNNTIGLMAVNKVPPEKRIFRRSPKSDLYYRFQRQNDSLYETTPPMEG